MNAFALVLAHNEELQLPACLRSLASLGRVVVVDSGSTDGTLEAARAFPNVEVVERPFDSFACQRNAGLHHFAAGEWVLHLDADEEATPELLAEIGALQPGAAVAFNIASLTVWRGRAIPRASGFPVYQTRLARAGAFRFVDQGHGQKAPPGIGALPRLRAHYLHHPFEKGIAPWRERHARYARDEARWLASAPGPPFAWRDAIARRAWLNAATARLPFRPVALWLYLMIVRGGVLEGAAGLEYCSLRVEYERAIRRELRALRNA